MIKMQEIRKYYPIYGESLAEVAIYWYAEEPMRFPFTLWQERTAPSGLQKTPPARSHSFLES
jgi:hypothetical protein